MEKGTQPSRIRTLLSVLGDLTPRLKHLFHSVRFHKKKPAICAELSNAICLGGCFPPRPLCSLWELWLFEWLSLSRFTAGMNCVPIRSSLSWQVWHHTEKLKPSISQVQGQGARGSHSCTLALRFGFYPSFVLFSTTWSVFGYARIFIDVELVWPQNPLPAPTRAIAKAQ